MSKVFSFCLYGSLEKYCRGMLENIKLIDEYFSDFEIWIYLGSDVPESYLEQYKEFPKVKLIQTSETGADLMCYRYFPIDDPNVEYAFFRDADSRIKERDRWCIHNFMVNIKQAHIIHDHYWHKTRITGGTWGVKKGLLSDFEKSYREWLNSNKSLSNKYGTDQTFLEEVIYPKIADNVLIHSNIIGYQDEDVSPIPKELFSNKDFVGNVYLFKENGDEYTEFEYLDKHVINHLSWLEDQQHLDIVTRMCDEIVNSSYFYQVFNYLERFILLDHWSMCHYQLGEYEQAQKVYIYFQNNLVSKDLVINSNVVLYALNKERNKKLIATTDPYRDPNDDEIVICYGNYCYDVDNLPHSNKLYRHPIFFEELKHDSVEYSKCWDGIDIIYIINLEERKDRYMETLVELCRVNAPLNKLYHYKAQKIDVIPGDKLANIYYGATKNHLDVVKHFTNNPDLGKCMVLEDDFTFVDPLYETKQRLKTFLERDYNFDVCLISSSKEHDIKPYDDLLSLSYQECTTTSGYILRKESALKVLICFEEGCKQIKNTRNYNKYVCDRYWSIIQSNNKFFLFKKKLGYQRPSYSSISKQTNLNLD